MRYSKFINLKIIRLSNKFKFEIVVNNFILIKKCHHITSQLVNITMIIKDIGGDLGLSLTGMRIGPRDPNTHVAKVGVRQEIYKPEHSLLSL